MKPAFRILSSLALLAVAGLFQGPEYAQAGKRCSLNLFQAQSSATCEEKNGSENGLFSMYAKTPPATKPSRRTTSSSPQPGVPVSLVPANLPSVSQTGANIELLSLNSELSHKGPNANARLVGGCDGSGTARLLLDFPGYPLFIGNQHLQVAVLGNGGRGVSLVSGMGTGFTELAIHGHQALSGLSAIAAKRNNSKLVFKLKDQDGLDLKADFDAAEFSRKIELVLSHCRRT